MIQFAVFTAPGGALLADYSARVQSPVITTNTRGAAECSAFVPMGLDEAFRLYDRPALPHVVFSDSSSGVIYEGRLEDVDIGGGGVTLRAFGYSRALGDMPYTAMWSTTDLRQWRPMTSADSAGYTPEKYTFNQDSGQLYITTKKGLTYANGADVAAWIIRIPDDSSRQIAGVSFDYTIMLPFNWSFEIQRWTNSFVFQSNTVIGAANGAPYNRTLHATITGCDILALVLYNNTGAASTPAGDDGTNYLSIRNVRVVTSIGNRVNTTLGTTFGAGGSQTVTPPSMANIYVGQQLQIKNNGVNSTSVVVTAVTSTTFTAVFPMGYNLADAVNAFVVYGDEIVKDMRSTVSGLNSAQIAASDALVQLPSVDLLNESYEDRPMTDILDYLAAIGDNQATPRQWEWGVAAGRLLYFRPQNSANRTWYIDVSDLDVQRSIDGLSNYVYATYQDASGRTLRAASSSDAASITRYGLTRKLVLPVSTTSLTQAQIQQAAALADNKDPKPRSGVTIARVFDASGARWPLYAPVAGDTMIIRNLSPTLSTAIDRVRVFRLTRTEYHADSDTLTIEPESPLPSLSALLARVLPSGIGFHGAPYIKPR